MDHCSFTGYIACITIASQDHSRLKISTIGLILNQHVHCYDIAVDDITIGSNLIWDGTSADGRFYDFSLYRRITVAFR